MDCQGIFIMFLTITLLIVSAIFISMIHRRNRNQEGGGKDFLNALLKSSPEEKQIEEKQKIWTKWANQTPEKSEYISELLNSPERVENGIVFFTDFEPDDLTSMSVIIQNYIHKRINRGYDNRLSAIKHIYIIFVLDGSKLYTSEGEFFEGTINKDHNPKDKNGVWQKKIEMADKILGEIFRDRTYIQWRNPKDEGKEKEFRNFENNMDTNNTIQSLTEEKGLDLIFLAPGYDLLEYRNSRNSLISTWLRTISENTKRGLFFYTFGAFNIKNSSYNDLRAIGEYVTDGKNNQLTKLGVFDLSVYTWNGGVVPSNLFSSTGDKYKSFMLKQMPLLQAYYKVFNWNIVSSMLKEKLKLPTTINTIYDGNQFVYDSGSETNNFESMYINTQKDQIKAIEETREIMKKFNNAVILYFGVQENKEAIKKEDKFKDIKPFKLKQYYDFLVNADLDGPFTDFVAAVVYTNTFEFEIQTRGLLIKNPAGGNSKGSAFLIQGFFGTNCPPIILPTQTIVLKHTNRAKFFKSEEFQNKMQVLFNKYILNPLMPPIDQGTQSVINKMFMGGTKYKRGIL